MTATGTVPVWTSNRGTMMMIRVALTQSGRTPVFVGSWDEFRKAANAADCQCVICGLDEVAQAGLTPQGAATAMKKGLAFVFVVSGQAIVDIPGVRTRIVRIPFSAAELRQAIETGEQPEAAPASGNAAPAQTDLTEIVRAEIDRIVREKAEAMVADAVMKIVPELAEVMIKAELQRLLSEESEKAVSSEPPADDDE